MNLREDSEFNVIRISHVHPCYQRFTGFRSFDEALDLWMEIASRYPFDDVLIVEKHWSDVLNCYVGLKV